MQVKKIAVLAAALLLCSCGEADNSDVLSEAALTSSETSATEIIDETTAREILTEEYPVSEESISESEVTTETSSEISAETSSEIPMRLPKPRLRPKHKPLPKAVKLRHMISAARRSHFPPPRQAAQKRSL